MNQHHTSTFGRGWIPMERDIGLPDDVDPFAPLPPAGGPESQYCAGGFDGSAAFASAHPDPSHLREGHSMSLPFTPDRRVRFLHLLATTGNVRRACALVGVSAQAAYVHKRRDAAFAHGWQAALLLARDAAEEVLAERALHGVSETIFYRGEAVGSRVRFDARLLLAHLARLDRHQQEAAGAAEIAARFDDYLAELTAGAPRFEAPFHDPEAPPQWSPAQPTRDEALLDARERALHRFPARFEDLPPETRAELEATGLDKYDGWSRALAQSQSRAEQSAAATWDEAAEASLSALDALLDDAVLDDAVRADAPVPAGAAIIDPGPPPVCAPDGRSETACAAGGEGGPAAPLPSHSGPAEPPLETKSLAALRTVSTLSTCAPPGSPRLRPAPLAAARFRLAAGTGIAALMGQAVSNGMI